MLHDRHYSSEEMKLHINGKILHNRHQMIKIPNYLKQDAKLPHTKQRQSLEGIEIH